MGQERQDFLAILYAAQAEPVGLGLRVPLGTLEQARQRLYAARAKAKDEALAGLQVRIAPSALRAQGIDLVIVKGAKRGPTEELIEELGI